jgi:hypothetical protein
MERRLDFQKLESSEESCPHLPKTFSLLARKDQIRNDETQREILCHDAMLEMNIIFLRNNSSLSSRVYVRNSFVQDK